MAEDKKTSGPVPGKDLTSKIATAYRSLPPEQRAKPAQESADVQNPELDQAFDKMVEMYKVKRPERENSVVTFPTPPTMRAPRPRAEAGVEYECPECGHNNPAGNQFCGMCGAAREDVTAASASESKPDESTLAAASFEAGVKHHHHYYHHHHYRNNPYLLAAVVLLLGIIAWQQWREYKQVTTAPAVAPAVKAQPQPQQSAPVPAPSAQPATPAAVPPATNGKPAKKPASQAPASQAPAAPVRRGEPPGPQARASETSPPAVVPPFQTLPAQPMPTLQTFSQQPPNPVPAPQAAPQRLKVSQGVSAGRLIRKVSPVYPANAQRIQGEVVLQAVIAKDGSVQSVKVVSGNPVLAEAAVEAVRQWRYHPYVLNGEPVEVETRVQVNFKR